MNTTPPPPFGDPANIRRENAAAVKKGVAVGCGGCFLMVALLFAAMAAVVSVAMVFMRSSDVAQETLKRAQNSPVLVQELGSPIEMGWLLSGHISIINDSGTAEMSVPVSGPLGSATIRSHAVKKDGGPWQIEKMETRLPSGATVDLLKAGQMGK